MGLLSADEIFGKADLTTEDIFILEWGGTVRIREAMASERDEYEQSLFAPAQGDGPPVRNFVNARARLVARCMLNEKNERVFSNIDLAVGKLGNKSAAVIALLYHRITVLSGMAPEEKEELEKNSEAGGIEGSPSFLPATSA